MTKINSITIIVRNSPIEFVVSGPFGGRDRILVRSENAGLELIGLVAENDDSFTSRAPSLILLSLYRIFRPGEFRAHVVDSMFMPDLQPKSDARNSRLRFAWKGLGSRQYYQYIEDSLNSSLSDLYRGIYNSDIDEVEFAIAPLIARCVKIDSRLRKRINNYSFILVAYAAAIIVAGIYFSIRDIRLF
jgi:hypothetical protein